MGTDSPSWVPGEGELEARSRLEDGSAGLWRNLPPGTGTLLQVTTEPIARAFAAYAAGDWQACDACLAEGLAAAGGIFTGYAEHITTPG